jgi:hypothetical protein
MHDLKTAQTGRLAPSATLALAMLATLCAGQVSAKDIVHDGEYYFVQAQHKDAWAKEDVEVEARLAEIRKKNDGKRPNILYVLIDGCELWTNGKPGDELRHRH